MTEPTTHETERLMRLWMADCAARVLPIFEGKNESLAPRKAIIAARQYARGEIDSHAMEAASSAAYHDCYNGDSWSCDFAAHAATMVSAEHMTQAVQDVSMTIADVMASHIVPEREGDEWSEIYNAERQWQFDRLIMWLSGDEPEVLPL